MKNNKSSNITQICQYLESIEECAEVARGYINKEYDVNDVDELVVALAAVSEEIEEIENLISELMEEDYE